MDQRNASGGAATTSATTPSVDVGGDRGRRRRSAGTPTHGRGRSRLSFVLPSLDVGGAEQVTVNIVNGLAARGYDVDLVVSRYEGRLRAELDADVTVVPLSDGRTPVVGVAAEFGPIVAYLEQAQPAALIPHLPRMSVVCLAAARVAGTDAAVFPTHHSAYGHGHDAAVKSRAVDWLVRRLYPTAERVIAVSEGVADGLARQTAVDRSDVSVLHNPIDVETVRERARDPVEAPWVEDDDAAVVLFVGRLADQKDLETWLGAFARIRERRPAVRGVVAGQGPQRASVRTLVDDLGLGDAVAVPGYVDNPYRYMAKADLFMLSSRYEGLPTVLIEAMACGCPVVATDCPSGPREILADGRHGGLAPVGDAAGLAEAAVATLDDPPAARRLRVRAEEFAPAAVLDEYEAFLRKYVTTA